MNQKFFKSPASPFMHGLWMISFFLVSLPALAQPVKNVQFNWQELSPSVLEKSSLIPLLQIKQGSVKAIDNRPYPAFLETVDMPDGIYTVVLTDAVYEAVQRTDLLPYFPAVGDQPLTPG